MTSNSHKNTTSTVHFSFLHHSLLNCRRPGEENKRIEWLALDFFSSSVYVIRVILMHLMKGTVVHKSLCYNTFVYHKALLFSKQHFCLVLKIHRFSKFPPFSNSYFSPSLPTEPRNNTQPSSALIHTPAILLC